MGKSFLISVGLICSLVYAFILSTTLYRKSEIHGSRTIVVPSSPSANGHVIDLVITYVNGASALFQRSLALAKDAEEANLPPFSSDRNRFEDKDDLRFLLRSVDAYGEIFRKIFLIVADESQVPSWLNVTNRLEIVFHRDIWYDLKELPNFNSLAIEANLHHIKGLAELFVYCNDDYLFVAPAAVDDFFQMTPSGEFLSFTTRSAVYKLPKGLLPTNHSEAHYANPAVRSRDLLFRDDVCGRGIFESTVLGVEVQRYPQHSPHALIKSVLERAENVSALRRAFETTWRSKLRSGAEFNIVHFFQNYAQCGPANMNATRGSVEEIMFLHFGQPITTRAQYEKFIGILLLNVARIARRPPSTPPHPKYVCINDDTSQVDADEPQSFSRSYSRVLGSWRETLFPVKSVFEREGISSDVQMTPTFGSRIEGFAFLGEHWGER